MLNLVGGVSGKDLAYFEKVKTEAQGENVIFHENASHETLVSLLKTCGIFWHATGMNVDQSSPEKLEHFGISLVEAMSAGLAPFAFDSAGPHEILKSYSNNLFNSLTDLVTKTIDFESKSDQFRHTLSSEMISNANRFDIQKFESRALSLLNDLFIKKEK
jgi:glycosyltransferase involved in cell wall biosynthesis